MKEDLYSNWNSCSTSCIHFALFLLLGFFFTPSTNQLCFCLLCNWLFFCSILITYLLIFWNGTMVIVFVLWLALTLQLLVVNGVVLYISCSCYRSVSWTVWLCVVVFSGVHICDWCYRISLHPCINSLTLDNSIPDYSSGFSLLNIRI